MSLSQVNNEGTVIYSVYPLMNNHCYCNTVYTIKPDTKVMEVRAQRSIKTGEEISTRYVLPSMEQSTRSTSRGSWTSSADVIGVNLRQNSEACSAA